MAPRSRDPDQPGISEAVRAKRLKMQEIGRQMEAAPPRSVVRKPRADDRPPEEIERDENLTMAVDPRTGRLPLGLYDTPKDDPYDPRYRGTQTTEGMAHTGALPEDERAYLHLGPPGTRPSGIPLPPAKPAPPLSKPPIAPPSTPGQPIVRGRGVRGGGGAGPPVHQILPQMRPHMANPDSPTNPMGLSPNSPFRYEQGGMVKKHGSSTHVPCATKHR